ncbi:MAG: hypothetical protein QXR76_03355 [Candidatus Bathyarchaeia archaeon]
MSEGKCLLCERKGKLRSYYYSDGEQIEVTLCQYHYGCYMAHGIKRLDKEMKRIRNKIKEAEK